MPRRHSAHGKHRRGRHAGSRGRRGAGGIAGFIEPAVLLLLSEGSAHGYELADELTAFMPAQRVDVGNLYRLLRRLEEDGLVSSVWDEGEAGRAKRVYDLTGAGADVLDDWAERLRDTGAALQRFLDRHAAGHDAEHPRRAPSGDAEGDDVADSGDPDDRDADDPSAPPEDPPPGGGDPAAREAT